MDFNVYVVSKVVLHVMLCLANSNAQSKLILASFYI